MELVQENDFVLGLDIGANSIGWALLALDDGRPSRLASAGVRVFAAGVEGDVSSGRDESRSVKRRQARLRRRLCKALCPALRQDEPEKSRTKCLRNITTYLA